MTSTKSIRWKAGHEVGQHIGVHQGAKGCVGPVPCRSRRRRPPEIWRLKSGRGCASVTASSAAGSGSPRPIPSTSVSTPAVTNAISRLHELPERRASCAGRSPSNPADIVSADDPCSAGKEPTGLVRCRRSRSADEWIRYVAGQTQVGGTSLRRRAGPGRASGRAVALAASRTGRPCGSGRTTAAAPASPDQCLRPRPPAAYRGVSMPAIFAKLTTNSLLHSAPGTRTCARIVPAEPNSKVPIREGGMCGAHHLKVSDEYFTIAGRWIGKKCRDKPRTRR